MMGLSFGMGTFGFILMLLFWGGLIVLAIWLIALIFPVAGKPQRSDETSLSAEEILKTRYARGELTPTEYHEMLNTIQQEHV